MALGGGKIGGAKKGRIRSGMQTDGGKFGERPLKDEVAASEGGGGGGGGGDDGRRYLNMATGASGDAPPQDQPPAYLLNDDGEAPSEEAIRSLGPVERRGTKQQKKRGENGVSPDGPIPLKIERGGGVIPGAAGRGSRLNPAQQAYAQSLGGAGVPDNVRRDLAAAAGGQRDGSRSQPYGDEAGPNSMTSEVNIINHTDVSLRMIAVDTAGSGQKVERMLPAKSGDNFIAPLGCTISIIHPVTLKAVFRYKVTDASTTLAVTDAALSGAMEADGRRVGSSGKWYDNRVFMIAAGAGVVCGLLLVIALIALLVRHLVKRQKLKFGSSSPSPSLGGGGSLPSGGGGWQRFK